MSTRLTLRRDDGAIFLERWGIECKRFGIFVHRMDAPDPGVDLHNHPWAFWSFVFSGGYFEQRADELVADEVAREYREGAPRGRLAIRNRFSLKKFRLDEAHRIYYALPNTWTLVFRGKVVRSWGFFTPDGYMTATDYEKSYWGLRRGLSED